MTPDGADFLFFLTFITGPSTSRIRNRTGLLPAAHQHCKITCICSHQLQLPLSCMMSLVLAGNEQINMVHCRAHQHPGRWQHCISNHRTQYLVCLLQVQFCITHKGNRIGRQNFASQLIDNLQQPLLLASHRSIAVCQLLQSHSISQCPDVQPRPF